MKLLTWIPTTFLLLFFSLLFSQIQGKHVNTTRILTTNETENVGSSKIKMIYTLYGNLTTYNISSHPTNITGFGNKSQEEACGQIPEKKPPDLLVTIKKKADTEQGSGEEINYFNFSIPSSTVEDNLEETGDTEKNETILADGILITCTADYPVYLDFQLNDGYVNYFFRSDVKYCKCDPEACTLSFKIGIWLPMNIWDSVQEEQNKLAFTCRSVSGKAHMQKKAVLTRRANETHNVEILTISTEELEAALIPSETTGRAFVRFGNCQLDTHDDYEMLSEASDIINYCKDGYKTEDTSPCLVKVYKAPMSGTNNNSFDKRGMSPLLSPEVLDKLICNFTSTPLPAGRDEPGCVEDTGECEPDCCPECIVVLFTFTMVFTVPMCWIIFIKTWCHAEDDLPIAMNSSTIIRAQCSLHEKWKVRRVVLIHD